MGMCFEMTCDTLIIIICCNFDKVLFHHLKVSKINCLCVNSLINMMCLSLTQCARTVNKNTY